jgi:hypothetical protein
VSFQPLDDRHEILPFSCGDQLIHFEYALAVFGGMDKIFRIADAGQEGSLVKAFKRP